jgi:hypothetical protein
MGGLVTLEVKPTCSDNCTTTAKTEILQRVHPEGRDVDSRLRQLSEVRERHGESGEGLITLWFGLRSSSGIGVAAGR